VTFKGRLVKDGDDAFLRGRIGGGLACTCARCLEPARLPLDLTMNVTFVARTGDDADADADDDDDDEKRRHLRRRRDRRGGQIRDQILLAMPINPLCRESCAGLCPFCGGNRKLQPCDCASRQEAPRNSLAAALGKLKM